MMRGLWIVLVVVFACMVATAAAAAEVITSDPNTPAAREQSADAPDTRLAQKVSYECRSKPTREILDDFTEMTGVYFISGKNRRDWRVRDAKVTILVKDVTLAELMNSIARVMKFRWSLGGESPDWTYRMVDDDEAVRKAEAKFDHIKQDMRTKRVQLIDQLRATAKMSEDEINNLQGTNPYLHLLGKTGLAKAFVSIIGLVPGLKDAIIDQSDFYVPNSQLSPAAKMAVQQIAKLSWMQISGGKPMPKYFADDLDQMDVRVKSHDNRTLVFMNGGGYLGGFNVGKGNSIDYLGVSLEDPNHENVKADNKQRAGRIDGKEPTLTPEEQEILRSWYKDTCIEPFLPHPDLPELHSKVTVQLTGQRDDVIVGTARQIKLNMVTDSYAINRIRRAGVSVDDGEIVEVLDALAEHRGSVSKYNWDKSSAIVEVNDRNWYFERENEIPDAWVEEWRQTVKETGTLDLDQLAQIAALTDNQYWPNVGRDKILGNNRLYHQIKRSGDYLKVYKTLSRSQRSALLSKHGLSLASLNAEQQQAVLKIISGLEVPEGLPDLRSAGLDVRATGSRIQKGRKYVYTFRGRINGVPLPGEYILSTPEYRMAENEPSNDFAPMPIP